jgi:hypothetical protein
MWQIAWIKAGYETNAGSSFERSGNSLIGVFLKILWISSQVFQAMEKRMLIS